MAFYRKKPNQNFKCLKLFEGDLDTDIKVFNEWIELNPSNLKRI